RRRSGLLAVGFAVAGHHPGVEHVPGRHVQERLGFCLVRARDRIDLLGLYGQGDGDVEYVLHAANRRPLVLEAWTSRRSVRWLRIDVARQKPTGRPDGLAP